MTLKQNARFVNVFRNTDKPQIIHFTLTPRQLSLLTSIYLATLLQTWVLSHLNYNLQPAYPAGKHEKLTSYIEVKQYHQTEQTDGVNTDHSNLNIVCITSALHPICICILCYLKCFLIIIIIVIIMYIHFAFLFLN